MLSSNFLQAFYAQMVKTAAPFCLGLVRKLEMVYVGSYSLCVGFYSRYGDYYRRYVGCHRLYADCHSL